MLKSSSGMSIAKAVKFLYTKGIYYYMLHYGYGWNSGYKIFNW